MKNFVFALALAGTMSPLSTAPLYAGVQDSLGECYNILISWCNDNSAHVDACANNVMDECDELHGAGAMPDNALPLASTPKHKPTKRTPQADPAPGRDSAGGTAGRG